MRDEDVGRPIKRAGRGVAAKGVWRRCYRTVSVNARLCCKLVDPDAEVAVTVRL